MKRTISASTTTLSMPTFGLSFRSRLASFSRLAPISIRISISMNWMMCAMSPRVSIRRFGLTLWISSLLPVDSLALVENCCCPVSSNKYFFLSVIISVGPLFLGLHSHSAARRTQAISSTRELEAHSDLERYPKADLPHDWEAWCTCYLLCSSS